MKSDNFLYFRLTIHPVYIGDYKRRKKETRDGWGVGSFSGGFLFFFAAGVVAPFVHNLCTFGDLLLSIYCCFLSIKKKETEKGNKRHKKESNLFLKPEKGN